MCMMVIQDFAKIRKITTLIEYSTASDILIVSNGKSFSMIAAHFARLS